jgi:multimeric flavodoxin WrbA
MSANQIVQPKTLLLVAHSPSKNLQTLVDHVLKAANLTNQESSPDKYLKICYKTALLADANDVKQADALILLTPENLGYMSGGMKDFFDRIYYPCLEEKQGLPIAALIRAGHDGTGTKRGLESITSGLKWRWVQEPLVCQGEWQSDFIRQAEELAQAMSIALQEGMI